MPWGAGLRRAASLWRRSLRLRVVATTVTLCLVVVALLGSFLVDRIVDGLVRAKVEAALLEAQAGTSSAQESFGASDSADSAGVTDLAFQVVSGLATAGGPGGSKEILLLRSPTAAGAPLGGDFSSCRERAPRCDVPSELREAVQADAESAPGTQQQQLWQFTHAPGEDGTLVPAVAVGSRVTIPVAGGYELYYLFPMDREQATVELVRRVLAVGGVALVALVGAIVVVVSRQVVNPVRMAARIAERLAAGRLEERMRERGEDDLARLAASFNKMATNLQRQIRQLEDLSRVQRRFVSDVSHELRTPLTTVRMAADVLHDARADFDPATARSAELLQAQLDRFESLLTDLLEISRYDAGAAVLETEPVDVRDLAQRVIEATASLAGSSGSAVRLHAPAAPVVAEVDSRRVDRVLRNLVVNAIEHGDGGPVDVVVEGDRDAVAVAVRDHGVGLRPGDAALVFARFWRADPARARTTGGTGLGLSIALEDARLHGGWLQAWGEPGDGAQFRLTLPRRAGEEVERSPIPLEPRDARRRGEAAAVGAPYRRTAEPRPPLGPVPGSPSGGEEAPAGAGPAAVPTAVPAALPADAVGGTPGRGGSPQGGGSGG